jgi:hypothetical protein
VTDLSDEFEPIIQIVPLGQDIDDQP